MILCFSFCTMYLPDSQAKKNAGAYNLGFERTHNQFPYSKFTWRPIPRKQTTAALIEPVQMSSSPASRRSSHRQRLRSSGTDDKSKETPKKLECVIKSTDMNEDLQQSAMSIALDAMNKFRVEKDIATYIKEEFDKRFQPSWHCVVGRNFGSYVTHETNHFIYFYVNHVAVMLFKTGF